MSYKNHSTTSDAGDVWVTWWCNSNTT